MNLLKSSELILKKFYITNTTLLCVFPEQNNRIRLDKLKLSCDFNIFISNKNANKFNFVISFNIKCNEEEKPGYFFDIGSVGEFTLNNYCSIDEKIEKQYILYTALPMIINSTRTYIQNITSMHAFGTYLLPTLDLGKLIMSKTNDTE